MLNEKPYEQLSEISHNLSISSLIRQSAEMSQLREKLASLKAEESKYLMLNNSFYVEEAQH